MMADGSYENTHVPLTLRLSVPAAGAFRDVATAVAGKFAAAAGLSAGDSDRVAQAVDSAAAAVVQRAGGDETATLDLSLDVTDSRGVEIRVRCGNRQPEIVRVPSR